METKYLIPYLEHNLKVKQRPFNHIEELKSIDLFRNQCSIFNKVLTDEIPIEDIIPILKPLSDLRKDEFFDLYMDFCESLDMVNCYFLLEALEKGKYYAIDIQKYYKIEEFMNKNHFDWRFGLIEKGLAIDINSL